VEPQQDEFAVGDAPSKLIALTSKSVQCHYRQLSYYS